MSTAGGIFCAFARFCREAFGGRLPRPTSPEFGAAVPRIFSARWAGGVRLSGKGVLLACAQGEDKGWSSVGAEIGSYGLGIWCGVG